MPIASAATPPTIPGNEEYLSDFGVLHSDTYFLYPYEKKSLNIGISKYGEMIDLDQEVGLEYDGVDVFANPNGLEYDGVDVFANPNVPMEKWSNGWIMNIYYTDQSILKNVWAYAMTTDLGDADGIGGPWKQMQKNIVPVPLVDDRGGRRTSGYAESDYIRLIYDGPRKAIYLLNTTIYDKDPQNYGTALVRLTIQVVFNKVKKYVMEIKDIKRIDNDKMTGPMQIPELRGILRRTIHKVSETPLLLPRGRPLRDIRPRPDNRPGHGKGGFRGLLASDHLQVGNRLRAHDQGRSTNIDGDL
jgi:hypothetical protein